MADPSDEPKPKIGAPTKYRDEFVEQARKLALLGAIDEEIAAFFDVHFTTLYEWKLVHPEFAEAIKAGKLIADAEIASSLYHRAKGYSHDDVYPSSYEGQVTLTPIVKHYPPDTQAASLWLRNRQPQKWRDKVEIDLTTKTEPSEMTIEQIRAELAAEQARTAAARTAAEDGVPE